MVVADCENSLFKGAALDSRKEFTQFVFASQGVVSPCCACANCDSGAIQTVFQACARWQSRLVHIVLGSVFKVNPCSN